MEESSTLDATNRRVSVEPASGRHYPASEAVALAQAAGPDTDLRVAPNREWREQAGVSQTFRSQAFQTLGTVEKDNAFAVSGGLGMEFALKPRKTSLGIEGRMHKIFFRDRYEQTYLLSDIPDTTGDMYSIITSIIWFF